jgi:ribosomal protein S21
VPSASGLCLSARQWSGRLGQWSCNRSIEEERRVQVLVRDNNVDQALKVLKKKMPREGVFREMKLRGHYEKPSERRAASRAFLASDLGTPVQQAKSLRR